eukprot:613813-Hanusia_phi.AAC.1
MGEHNVSHESLKASAGDSWAARPEVCAGSVLVIVGRHQASSLGVADLVQDSGCSVEDVSSLSPK